MMPTSQLFFIDDDPKAGELFKRFCAQDKTLQVTSFRNALEALKAFRKTPCDLIITDLRMPDMTGIELLEAVRALDQEVPVIIITGYSNVENAIEALRLGASDFIKKPYDMEELIHQVQLLLTNSRLKNENRNLKQALAHSESASTLLGNAPAMQQMRELIKKLAEIRCNVIIDGESGTGKELVARDLHCLSPHADKPFIVIDCGAMTDTLLESELFGHERGAFTGADQQRIGRLETAAGGSVFLDEICNISDAMQTKLLRVVQEQQITRVGGAKPVAIDVRFIAATNRNLEALVASGEFRHDLYHRLNVVQIHVPPLRERGDDIALLCQHFIQHFNEKYQRHATHFSGSAMTALMRYEWPGNVRELRNLVERHVALCDDGILELQTQPKATEQLHNDGLIDDDQPDLKTLEQRYILKILKAVNGNREKATEILGINKSTLWRKLQQYSEHSS